MATTEILTVIAGIAAIVAAGIIGIMALRFTHFDKETKALKKKVIDEAANLDALLDSQVKNSQTADKRTIKKLVAQMSACEARISDIDDIRKSIRGNFKFDWVVLFILALIPVSAYAINPFESSYPAMFLLALIVAVHIMMFVSRVFEFMKLESQIEEEEETERKKLMGE